MDSAVEYYEAKAALEWQIELGADEAIGDVPLDRYELVAESPKVKAAQADPAGKSVPKPSAAPIPIVEVDAVAVAKVAAANAADLVGLEAALAGFNLCELKRGARNLVFADGALPARVMIISEAPNREDDRAGKPFSGQAGVLLDRMLAAIDLGRDGSDSAPPSAGSVYTTTALPWRTPQDRDPTPDEIAMLRPFIERHVELAAPDVVVLMGNAPCSAMLGRKGITRLRGTWESVMGRPALPMFHPAYLLRNPRAKREAWADLLELKAKLDSIA
ncbi:uracil-DNA glycosylase [Marinosulfonomonas sp. PRT-SC04]|nr:uracil-DNA glycosylase [Marinosulfonomonas sp. PRT-SC04]